MNLVLLGVCKELLALIIRSIESLELLLSANVNFSLLYWVCLTSGAHRDADRTVAQNCTKAKTSSIYYYQIHNYPPLAYYTATNTGHPDV